MRKVTEQTAFALSQGRAMRSGNTQVIETQTGHEMLLHGNLIARVAEGSLTISDAGWRTTTTKERLNGVLDMFNTGIQIFQKKGVWYARDRVNNITEKFPGTLTIDLIK